MSNIEIKNKAYCFRIYPNKDQIIYFSKVFGCCRFIYNKMLSDKIEYYKENKKELKVTPASYKSDFPFLKEVDSLALSNVQLNLNNAFKKFFKEPHVGFPKFKSKKISKQSYTTNNQKGTIKLEDGFIKLPKIGLVKIKMHREIPDNYLIKSATIVKEPSNVYYVSVLFEYENQVQENNFTDKVLGLDYSMHELYKDSEGNEPSYPKYYRQSEKKLARENRKLSKMKKGSNNFAKQKLKLAKIYAKVKNQRNDFLHKESKRLADNYNVICIENLNMKAMSQMLNFGKSVLDNGWGMFTSFLAYKLKDQGKKLIKIDRFFASSQTCHVCGYKNVLVKNLAVREWVCPTCNTIHDRDMNAAINIKYEGMKHLA